MRLLNQSEQKLEVKEPLLNKELTDISIPVQGEYDINPYYIYLQKKYELEKVISLLKNQIKKRNVLNLISKAVIPGLFIFVLMGIALDMILKGLAFNEKITILEITDSGYRSDYYGGGNCLDFIGLYSTRMGLKRVYRSGYESGFLTNCAADATTILQSNEGDSDLVRSSHLCGALLRDACSLPWSQTWYGATILVAIGLILVLAGLYCLRYKQRAENRLKNTCSNYLKLKTNDQKYINWMSQKYRIQQNDNNSLETTLSQFIQKEADVEEDNINYQIREVVVAGAKYIRNAPISRIFHDEIRAPIVLKLIFGFAEVVKGANEQRRNREAFARQKELAGQDFMDSTDTENENLSLQI